METAGAGGSAGAGVRFHLGSGINGNSALRALAIALSLRRDVRFHLGSGINGNPSKRTVSVSISCSKSAFI